MPVRKKMPRPYRKPTYGAGARLARIVRELTSRPHGWSFEAIQEELRIAPSSGISSSAAASCSTATATR